MNIRGDLQWVEASRWSLCSINDQQQEAPQLLKWNMARGVQNQALQVIVAYQRNAILLSKYSH